MTAAPDSAPLATRKDLQLGRRLFHMTNGVTIAGAYALFFTHEQVIHVFGTIACLVYVFEQVRLHYPELAERAPSVNRAFYRAEEQFRESAMIPYAIAILLTILTFPKTVALIAILALGVADPLAAIVGITWGKRRIVEGKTIEGSLAFFAATFACAAGVLRLATPAAVEALLGASFLIALLGAGFEMAPLRIDDNLTIPLFVGFAAWAVCAPFAIPL